MIGRDRDLRLDLFRGLALIIIYIDHVGDLAREAGVSLGLRLTTLRDVGWSDASEIFVFVSGYAVGMSYARRLRREGFASCVGQATRRVGQLHAANLLALGLVLVAMSFLAAPGDLLTRYTGIGSFVEHPVQGLLAAAALYVQPYGFDILPLYVALILAAPWALRAAQRRPRATLAASLALYGVVQLAPGLNFPEAYREAGWSFNPLAWQLLFCVALVSGARREAGAVAGKPRLAFVVAAALGLVASFLVVRGHWPAATQRLGAIIGGDSPWLNKSSLGALRLAHFAALAYFVGVGIPVLRRVAALRVMGPIVRCGQQSLWVFGAGLVLTYVHAALLAGAEIEGVFPLVLASGVALHLAVAYAVERAKRWLAARPELVSSIWLLFPLHKRRKLV